MIVTARTGIAKPGHLSDALLFTAGIVENMNSKFGVDFSVNIEVGGDPNAMHLVGRFESMGDYQEFREAYMADAEMSEQIKQGAELADITEDILGEVIVPTERNAYGVINTLQAISTNQPAAMEFCAQVCGLASEIIGTPVGLLRRITGDLSMVSFVIGHSSLQAVYDAEAACLSDERYLALYAESASFMVPNSATASIRQRIV
tara:strand:- start:111 stop:722 length:612 start_codon:yes stop_codon:yes gene_type:complete